MYATGEGVPENDTEAVRWFRMAAEQGIADAQSYLGYMYLSRPRHPPKRYRGSTMVSHGRRAGECRCAAHSGLHV